MNNRNIEGQKIVLNLRAKHPEILSSSPLAFEPGWVPLIDALCISLQYETVASHAPQVRAVQVKQKFGTLRFYTMGELSDRQRGMINLAEEISGLTCEKCGCPGEMMVIDWLWSPRCARHREGGVSSDEFLASRGKPQKSRR